jgi:hypothetical protein
MLENKENNKLPWVVTDDVLSLGVLIFSDKVLENCFQFLTARRERIKKHDFGSGDTLEGQHPPLRRRKAGRWALQVPGGVPMGLAPVKNRFTWMIPLDDH